MPRVAAGLGPARWNGADFGRFADTHHAAARGARILLLNGGSDRVAWPPTFRPQFARSDRPRPVDDRILSTRKINGAHQGPDLPTGAEIVSPRDELVQIRDGIRQLQGPCDYKDRGRRDRDRCAAVQYPGPKVQEQIAAQAAEKAADGRGPPRRVGPRESTRRHRAQIHRVDTAALMAHLFAPPISSATTVNLNVIALDGGAS